MRAQYLDVCGPMRGLHSAWDPLDVTGDGISHQLDGRDQQTAGQEQSGGNLMMMIIKKPHKTSFENLIYEHATALSTYIWKLKGQRAPFTTSWEII